MMAHRVVALDSMKEEHFVELPRAGRRGEQQDGDERSGGESQGLQGPDFIPG